MGFCKSCSVLLIYTISWIGLLTPSFLFTGSFYSFVNNRVMGQLDSLSVSLLWLSIISVIRSILLIVLRTQVIALWLVLLITLLISFLVSRLFSFYVFFELRLIPILLIILFFGSQPERLMARVAFLLYTLFLSMPYIILILIILPFRLFYLVGFNRYRRLVLVILLIPFMVKIPILGLHYWLPKAHVEANTSGSIILAGILLKLGRYGISRSVYLFPLNINIILTRWLWLILSVFRSVLTFIQSDIKKFIAYRSITHMTFLMLGMIVNGKVLFIRVVIISLAHGWASIGMFAGAGIFRHAALSRLGYYIGSEYGLHWFSLLVGVILIINASVPPIPSFFGEVIILLITIIVTKVIISIFVILRVIVCYYNAFLFILLNRVKPATHLTLKVTELESIVILMLFYSGIVSLGWLQFLFRFI